MAFLGRNSASDEARAAAYRDWLARRNPLAIASLALGIVSLIEAGALLVFGFAGIALGVIALRQLKQTQGAIGVPPDYLPVEGIVAAPPRDHGHRLAVTGIALSAISLVMATWLYGQRPHVSPTSHPTTQSTR